MNSKYPPVSVRSDSDRRNVLVVDDHHISRAFVMRIIEALGYHVITSDGGEDAIHVLSGHSHDPFNLVVVELNMPKIDGVDVVRCMRRLKMDTPVIFTCDGPLRYPMTVLTTITPHIIKKPITDIGHVEDLVTRAITADIHDGAGAR